MSSCSGRARSEPADRAVAIARQDMIVAAAEHQAQIGGGKLPANVEPADRVNRGRRTGGDLAEQARGRARRENPARPCPRRPRLLIEQVKSMASTSGLRPRCETHLPQLAEPLALRAVASPRGRGALADVKGLPVAGEVGEIGAARVERDRQGEKRVGLRADRFGHLLEDQRIETKAPIVPEMPRIARHKTGKSSRATCREKSGASSGAL